MQDLCDFVGIVFVVGLVLSIAGVIEKAGTLRHQRRARR